MKPFTKQLEVEQYGATSQKDRPIDYSRLPGRLPQRMNDPRNPLTQQLQTFTVAWNSNPIISNAFAEMSDLRRKYNVVNAGRDLPAMEKQQRLNELNEQINVAAAKVVEEMQTITEQMDTIYEGWNMAEFSAALSEAVESAEPSRTGG